MVIQKCHVQMHVIKVILRILPFSTKVHTRDKTPAQML